MGRQTQQSESEEKERMAIEKVKEFYEKLQNCSKQPLAAVPVAQKKNLIVKLPRVPSVFHIHSTNESNKKVVEKKKIIATKNSCSSHPRDFLILKSEKSFIPGKVRVWNLKEHLIGYRSISKSPKKEGNGLGDHKIKSFNKSKDEQIVDYSIERKEERQFQISRI